MEYITESAEGVAVTRICRLSDALKERSRRWV